MTQAKPKKNQNSIGRQLIVQTLYQQSLNETPIAELTEQTMQRGRYSKAALRFYKRSLSSLLQHKEQIDGEIAKSVEDLSKVPLISLALLRMAVFELLFCFEVPYKVVLNEAVELSKLFGSEETPGFVNGVLNTLAHQIRTIETQKK